MRSISTALSKSPSASVEGLLAVHHAGAGQLAELLDVGGGDVRHRPSFLDVRGWSAAAALRAVARTSVSRAVASAARGRRPRRRRSRLGGRRPRRASVGLAQRRRLGEPRPPRPRRRPRPRAASAAASSAAASASAAGVASTAAVPPRPGSPPRRRQPVRRDGGLVGVGRSSSSRSHSASGSSAPTPRSPLGLRAPERAIRPSATASATTRVSRATERIASSLPGIGKSTSSGSQLVSRMPMIGMRSLRASSTARCSFLVSTIQTADGRAGHLADAAQGLVELVVLALQLEQLLLGATGAGDVVEVELVELLEAVDPLVHGLEVGEHAAEPALVDVGHADAGRLLGDRLLGLLLGADEHHRAALGDGLLDEGVARGRCRPATAAGR